MFWVCTMASDVGENTIHVYVELKLIRLKHKQQRFHIHKKIDNYRPSEAFTSIEPILALLAARVTILVV